MSRLYVNEYRLSTPKYALTEQRHWGIVRVMEPSEYVLPVLSCYRCEHEWHPKTPTAPQTCPKCRSAYWHTPRRVKAAPEPPEAA